MSPKIAGFLLALPLLAVSCPAETPTPEEQADPVTEVIVQQGDRLRAIGIEDKEIRDVGTLPSDDTAVSPDGTTVAYVEPGRHNGTLFVGELDELDDARKVGLGKSPVFSPDGELVAAMTVDPNYNICPVGTTDPTSKGCVFGERIQMYSVEEGDPETALGSNAWKFIGWTADAQILAGAEDNGYLALGYAGATFEEFPRFTGFHPDWVFAVSPSEVTILFDNGTEIATQTLDATQAVTIPLALPGGTELLEAAWSPEGSWVAVLAERRGETEAFAVATTDGSVDALGEAIEGGGLTWSADGGSLAFVAGTGKSQEIAVCEPEGDCSTVPAEGPTRVLGLR